MAAVRKLSMCSKKVSFRTQETAQKVADKFGQRVYECPVCFCWHCTSKADWLEDITADAVRKAVDKAVMAEREAFNTMKKEWSAKNHAMRLENDQLRKLLLEQTKFLEQWADKPSGEM